MGDPDQTSSLEVGSGYVPFGYWPATSASNFRMSTIVDQSCHDNKMYANN